MSSFRSTSGASLRRKGTRASHMRATISSIVNEIIARITRKVVSRKRQLTSCSSRNRCKGSPINPKQMILYKIKCAKARQMAHATLGRPANCLAMSKRTTLSSMESQTSAIFVVTSTVSSWRAVKLTSFYWMEALSEV